MPRLNLIAWWCICGTRNVPSDSVCVKCSHHRFQKNAQVSESERCVVYYNPQTGEHRTPPRTDMPMPQQYASDGFERREIMNISQWEKESGLVHEATNFNSGNEPIPEKYGEPKISKEVKEAVIRDVADSIASDSGKWTGQDKFLERAL